MLLALVLVNAVMYAATSVVAMLSLAGSRATGPVTAVVVPGVPLVLAFNMLMMLFFGYEWATAERGAAGFVVAAVICGLSALGASSQHKIAN